jgi:periplasmic divalent cation tolerance protein
VVASDVRIVLVTAPDEGEAVDLCRTLIGERLVACGNIVGRVRSLYRWEGRIRDEAEFLLVLKTVESKVPDLLLRVPALHSYDVPEVLVLDVETGYEPYLSWLEAETVG